jgi:hypothetical protein
MWCPGALRVRGVRGCVTQTEHSCRGRNPNPFCTGCGQPFPWATRGERIVKLSSYLDFEDGLSAADRLLAEEQITELSELEEEDEPDTINRRVAVAKKLRDLAPGAWVLGQPILQTIISGEVLQHLR